MYTADLFFGSYIVAAVLKCCTCALINIRPYQAAILQAHNLYRSREPAANMRALVWDNFLAYRAAQWTETCYFEHQRRGFGENLSYFTSTGPPLSSRTAVQRSIGLWAAERPLWGRGPQCGAACHYTQLIWATTTRVGCALSYCPSLRVGMSQIQRNSQYFACFYSPPGNFIGQLPFIPGPRCSRCGRGQACVRGLCSPMPFGRRRRRSAKLSTKSEFLGIVHERSDGV
ncbi:peptidase inhibitor 15-A-like isoform X2 [Dreissena polymorpha]|nr:peptidase inhibitor 15-A-like isoform X2 [Dreissena polymorpha]XP_052257414.1 peptidase inhibitor 15-A-like isoform X2 [Dreissena polymorpha]